MVSALDVFVTGIIGICATLMFIEIMFRAQRVRRWAAKLRRRR